jgi:hypothetical protein
MSTLADHSSDTIELEAPVGRAWEPVVRLVLGGIADRLALSFEDLDDLQLAVERLLAEAGAQETVRLSFEVFETGVRTRIGPLAESPIAAALQGDEPRSGELSLRRILETVVDSYGIEHSDRGELIVRLEKVLGQG